MISVVLGRANRDTATRAAWAPTAGTSRLPARAHVESPGRIGDVNGDGLDDIALLGPAPDYDTAERPARATGGPLVDGGGAQYRLVMAGAGSEERCERARRAQQLSDRARERAGGERAAAERCERLMADAADPALRELHRQAADLHRQALHRYEEAARLQQLHADHERAAAAERVVAIESGGTDREATADRRDVLADQRDHFADVREWAADERERRADEREELQDEREGRQNERERRHDEAAGRWTTRQRDQLARAKSTLRRLEARLARDDAALDRENGRVRRDQATIDRESSATARSVPPPGNRRRDAPGEESK